MCRFGPVAKYFHVSDFKLSAAAFAGSRTLSPGFPSLLGSATNFTQLLKRFGPTFWPVLARSFVLRRRLFCHCDAEKLPKPLHPEYFTVTELPLDFYIRDVILLKRQNSKNAFSPRPPRGPGQHCSQFTDDTGLHYLSRLFQIKFNIHVFFCSV